MQLTAAPTITAIACVGAVTSMLLGLIESNPTRNALLAFPVFSTIIIAYWNFYVVLRNISIPHKRVSGAHIILIMLTLQIAGFLLVFYSHAVDPAAWKNVCFDELPCTPSQSPLAALRLFYYTVATFATSSYGDIVPTTAVATCVSFPIFYSSLLYAGAVVGQIARKSVDERSTR